MHPTAEGHAANADANFLEIQKLEDNPENGKAVKN
jgi:hypothetical protein